MEVDQCDNGPLSLDNLKVIDIKQKHCALCNCAIHPEIVIIPKLARLELLSLRHVYAPPEARCCASHLINNNHLHPKTTVNAKNDLKSGAGLLLHEVKDLCNELLALSEEFRSPSYLDFDDFSMTDEEYAAWTGWNKNQFDYMYDQISFFLRSSSNRTSRNAFAIFWIKMKTNLSFRQIDSLFKISDESESRRKRTANGFDSVRKLLVEVFVLKNMGIKHITKEQAKSHNTWYTKVIRLPFGSR